MYEQQRGIKTSSDHHLWHPFLLQERVFLSVSNYVFTVIFLVEMAIKVSTTLLDVSVCPFFFFDISTDPNMCRPSTNSTAPPGCCSGFLLWDTDLSPVQLERSRWFIGVCVTGGHTGFSGLHWWKQDPGHPQSPPSVAHTTSTQVATGFGFATCLLGCDPCVSRNPPN